MRDGLVVAVFDNAKPLVITEDHQILTEKGWGSFNPELTVAHHPRARRDYSLPSSSDNELGKLQLGDQLTTLEGSLVSITTIIPPAPDAPFVKTYTFRLRNTHTYFADGIPAMDWWGPSNLYAR
jgi:hypothetical protein